MNDWLALLLIGLPPGSWPATGAAAAIGLLIGGFMTVVTHRLPRMMQDDEDDDLQRRRGTEPPPRRRYNLLLPRSHCPACGHRLSPRHTIPLAGYLLARGRCTACRRRIGLRYPLIESLSAVVSAWLIWHFGSGAAGLAALAFGFALVALGAIDAETGLLPDAITLPLVWGGLLVNLHGLFVPLSDAVLGAVAGYLVLWAIFQCYRLATGKEAIGYGDFKLLAALGAWLGWAALPLALLLASIGGVLIGVGLKRSGRSAAGDMLPFGPYLAAAAIIVLMYGPALWQLLLQQRNWPG